MSKFKKGDKVYLDKRGKFGNEISDYTAGLVGGMYRLEKNTVYTVESVSNYGVYSNIRVSLNNFLISPFTHHEDHFIKYEQV